ncbi:MAG: class I SAM-dependent methyltransferase [Phycicoccus sp.]
MDRAEVGILAHRHHPVAAPVPDEVVERLLARVVPLAGGEVVDLGCGRGEWLRRLVRARRDVRGVGVDIVAHGRFGGLDELDEMIRWETKDASVWDEGPVDAVIVVGAGHAFGGLRGTVQAARRVLRPGGRVIVGEMFWERTPSPAVVQDLGLASTADLPVLTEMVDVVCAEGFEILDAHVSSQRDWADYEWSWTGSLVEWAVTEAADEARENALGVAREHRASWLDGYRGVLGFASLLLIDIGVEPDQGRRSGRAPLSPSRAGGGPRRRYRSGGRSRAPR